MSTVDFCAEPQALSEATFRRIAALMREAIGLHLSDSKRALVSSRLATRIQRLELPGFEAYLERLESGHDGGEFQVAIDLLTTNETYFFREPAHFELIERELVARPRGPLSVWSAASSFGDEAYSCAMLMSDLQQQGRIGPDWHVLATDISDRVLRSAVEAIYPVERLRHVAPQRLQRHCLRGDGASEGLVQMRPEIRERVRFGQLNLCRPIEPLGSFDVVLLRNVLIYFDNDTKRQVVDRVLEQLRPGGLFLIGTAEGRVACRTALQPVAPGAFRKA
ncbi:MAG: protein-glutamate O-methyltransferase CheR [Rubrivivax sp.]|nr:protein-glutamate O-methyltransferase CheR [Rubrivivax sp.]